MKKSRSMKNIGKFWKKRNKARAAMDRERASAPFAKKIEITEKLRKDAILIKTGKEI